MIKKFSNFLIFIGLFQVSLRGPKEDVEKVKQQLIELATELQQNSFTAEVKAKPQHHRFLIGKSGANIKRVRVYIIYFHISQAVRPFILQNIVRWRLVIFERLINFFKFVFWLFSLLNLSNFKSKSKFSMIVAIFIFLHDIIMTVDNIGFHA